VSLYIELLPFLCASVFTHDGCGCRRYDMNPNTLFKHVEPLSI